MLVSQILFKIVSLPIFPGKNGHNLSMLPGQCNTVPILMQPSAVNSISTTGRSRHCHGSKIIHGHIRKSQGCDSYCQESSDPFFAWQCFQYVHRNYTTMDTKLQMCLEFSKVTKTVTGIYRWSPLLMLLLFPLLPLFPWRLLKYWDGPLHVRAMCVWFAWLPVVPLHGIQEQTVAAEEKLRLSEALVRVAVPWGYG